MKCMVSIVMPSYNQISFIKDAIDSVFEQDYRLLELIVADGGSSDGTIEYLKQKQLEDSRLHWFSGQDSGPAEAINKALCKAKGTVLGWLNSDDRYTPGAIKHAVELLQSNTEWVMLYGHAVHIDSLGQVIDRYPTLPPETPLSQFSNGCFICQPSVFFKRTVYLLEGGLDESLKTSFDFDYWLRIFFKFQGRIGYTANVQAQSRLHADCITITMRRIVAVEGMQVVSRYFGWAPGNWLLTYFNELWEADGKHEKSKQFWLKHIEKVLSETVNYMTEAEFEQTKLQLKLKLQKICSD